MRGNDEFARYGRHRRHSLLNRTDGTALSRNRTRVTHRISPIGGTGPDADADAAGDAKGDERNDDDDDDDDDEAPDLGTEVTRVDADTEASRLAIPASSSTSFPVASLHVQGAVQRRTKRISSDAILHVVLDEAAMLPFQKVPLELGLMGRVNLPHDDRSLPGERGRRSPIRFMEHAAPSLDETLHGLAHAEWSPLRFPMESASKDGGGYGVAVLGLGGGPWALSLMRPPSLLFLGVEGRSGRGGGLVCLRADPVPRIHLPNPPPPPSAPPPHFPRPAPYRTVLYCTVLYCTAEGGGGRARNHG